MEITEVRLTTARVADLRRFYGEALGLPVSETAGDGFAVAAGATTLAFTPARRGEEPVYHVAFNVPENKLGLAKGWLSARTPLLAKDGEDEFAFPDWNAHAIYCQDPAGNVVELIARHDLANAAGGAFGPGDLRSVSEIGLVVADVGATVARLGRLGLPPYGDWGPAFAPVGDALGLLIVVPAGRPWLPTGTPAGAHPAVVTLRGAVDADYRPPGSPYTITTRRGSGTRQGSG